MLSCSMRWRTSAISGAPTTAIFKSGNCSAMARILLAALFSIAGSAITSTMICPSPRTHRSDSRQRGNSPEADIDVVWSYVVVTGPDSTRPRADTNVGIITTGFMGTLFHRSRQGACPRFGEAVFQLRLFYPFVPPRPNATYNALVLLAMRPMRPSTLQPRRTP